MPLLQDSIQVNRLRCQYPILTHTSRQRLNEIQPQKNVDTYLQGEREIVCATSDSLQRDFYALRCNEHNQMINHTVSIKQNGIMNKLFVFEKMNDRFYEHEISSAEFTPVVAPNSTDFVSGEWIAETTIKPFNVKEGTKEEILARTKAGVYTILDKERYLIERRSSKNWKNLKNPDMALSVIENMVYHGILKCEKSPQKQLMNLLSLVGRRGR